MYSHFFEHSEIKKLILNALFTDIQISDFFSAGISWTMNTLAIEDSNTIDLKTPVPPFSNGMYMAIV